MAITQYAMVMVFGALVAGAGLVLLVLRKEHAENRIKLFGQEFQMSTPALVVFLVGCAVFIIPVVIPAHDQAAISIVLPWQKDSSKTIPSSVIGGEEHEPNNQITEANFNPDRFDDQVPAKTDNHRSGSRFCQVQNFEPSTQDEGYFPKDLARRFQRASIRLRRC